MNGRCCSSCNKGRERPEIKGGTKQHTSKRDGSLFDQGLMIKGQKSKKLKCKHNSIREVLFDAILII